MLNRLDDVRKDFRIAPLKSPVAVTSLPKVYRPTDMLGNKHFALAVTAAIFLHALAWGVWYVLPKTEVVDVPVRPLTIKLGDGEVSITPEEMRALAPSTMDGSDNDQTSEQPAVPSGVWSELMKTTDGESKPAVVKQFVRETEMTPEAAAANLRYEQLVAMWMQKFRVYPKEARDQGIQGETAVRLRLDRRGNVRYYMLERSTGSPILDRAAIDMIRRANPAPAVPADYPAGDECEFLVPVHFYLQ